MSRFRTPACLCLVLLAAPAHAQTDAPTSEPSITLSGSTTLASQYRFRGISLSDEKIALQATVNAQHDSGVYAGIWGSSLDGFGELGGSNVELDLYAGWRGEIVSGLSVDAGLLYYAYPGSEGGDFEFFEPYASVATTLGPATAKLGIAYAPAQDGLGGNSNLYVYGDLSAGIPGTPLTIAGRIGRSEGDTPLSPGGGYTDWSLGATAAFGALGVGLAYVGTDISDDAAFAAGATPDIVDDALVLTLTASF